MEGGRGQVKQQILFIDKDQTVSQLDFLLDYLAKSRQHGFLPGRVNVIA